jgi:hypothetical protein
MGENMNNDITQDAWRKLKHGGRAGEIIRALQAQWRVEILTAQESFAIDNDLAIAFAKIKEESDRKQRHSRAAIREMESRKPYV